MKSKSKKIFWIILTIVIIFTIALVEQINNKEESIPKCIDCNIIFIDIDCLSANHLGIYGYHKNTSQNIDNFARKSILFKNVYSQVHWTERSVISLLTSSSPWIWERKINPNITTLPQIFKKNDYITGAITGGFQPHKPSIEDSFGFDMYYKLGEISLNLGDQSFNKTFRYGIEWIKKNKNKKFFLYLHGYDLHVPASCKYENYFDPDYNEGIEYISQQYIKTTIDLINKPRDYNFNNLKKAFFKPEQINHIIAHHDGCILYIDELFGNFIRELEREGLSNRTIIVIFSNHGQDLLENGLLMHLVPSYGTLHVPLIIFVPGAMPKSIEAPVALIDIMPTSLNLTNLTTNHSMLGIDLVSLIENPERNDKSRIIPGYQHLIKGNYALFTYPKFQVYNIKYDKNQSNNLADKRPEIIEEWRNEFSNMIIKSLLQKNKQPRLKSGYS